MVSEIAAQQLPDTSILLNEASVSSSRLYIEKEIQKTLPLDSSIFARNSSASIAEILAAETHLFIKSYGSGSLATTSFRGGSASHTVLLWNGFALNNAMNGQNDLSLLSSQLFSGLDIVYGGTSASWGSGAIGGTIHLKNEPVFNNGFKSSLALNAANFSSFSQSASASVSNQKSSFSVGIINASSKNNFPFYTDDSENSNKKLEHAEFKNQGITGSGNFILKNNQSLNFHIWAQNTDRNIPPVMLQDNSSAYQQDQSFRTSGEWKKMKKKSVFAFRNAFFYEKLNYTDSVSEIQSENNTQTCISEGEYNYRFNDNNRLAVAINNSFYHANTDGYETKKSQNRTAIFANYFYTSANKKYLLSANLRQEIVNKEIIPFTFSLSSLYKWKEGLHFLASASKVYRLPSLNDLYWNPGGNLNLLPENGFSFEGGITASCKYKELLKISFDASTYSRKISNWIIWMPGISFWTPSNLMEVWSRGTETKTNFEFILKNKTTIQFWLLTNYVISTNEKSTSENDASVDKQLIYVPMYIGHGGISVSFKEWSFIYRHHYTGYRYTSTDNYQYLNPYFLADFRLSFHKKIKKCNFIFFIQVNNLFNENYQIIRYRPMPLRNYQTGIQIKFHSPKKIKQKL